MAATESARTLVTPPGDRRRRELAFSLAIALALLGLVAVAQWRGESSRLEFTSSAVQVLSGQVLALQDEQQALREEIAGHEAEIAEFQERGGESQSLLERLNEQLDRARLAGGLAPLRGPGLVVEIADSNRVVPEAANPEDFIVQVDDLRDIVRALWASGAEAVSINDQRLVSTTSIYGAGSAILVNTALLSPTYRVVAIGPAELEERFFASPAFVGRAYQRIQTFDLEFATLPVEDIEVPGFVGNTRFTWAVSVAGVEQ